MAGPVELTEAELDLARWVRPGDGVVPAMACAEPVPLVDALVRQAPALGPLHVFPGLTWRDAFGALPEEVTISSWCALGKLRNVARLEVVPCHFSALPALFASGRLPRDVALIQVAPPDAQGRCSLGVGIDYLADMLPHARTVIAEVNDRCPATAGSWVAWDRLDAVVRSSRALLQAPPVEPGPTEVRIAEHVAELVRDGDTITLGVGALPEAILGRLQGHRRLGVHSGMISDRILELIDAGVVTNEHKPTDRGATVAGAALGSSRLFDALASRTDIRFLPVSHTHDPQVLLTVGRLSAINTAVEIDLTGQVNAEEIAGRRIGTVGGQTDFLRAATIVGGTPIVALGAERIVARLSGPVSTARSDVDWVVTEHGSRSLRGLSEPARRRALLELAGAERRDALLEPALP